MLSLCHPLKTSIFHHHNQRTPSQSPLTPSKRSLILTTGQPSSLSNPNPFLRPSIPRALDKPSHTQNDRDPKSEDNIQKPSKKSFWAAVTLIVGTAVGPGMLGLPSATVKSGPIPSTVAIVLSWVYVVSSIILVAELSFATMETNRVEEVSFTSLATNAFGRSFGACVAVVYACLSFSLLVACVSGIGSLVTQRFPLVNPIVAHSVVPCFVWIVIGSFPFEAIDVTNRIVCLVMLFSITALVTVGLSVGRSNLLGSLSFASWRFESIMPAIPLTVLTLGFHVITPFICKIVGDSMYDARKAILLGGAVPLVMVLSWNAVVLGLARGGRGSALEPIELLLSVNSSALPAVQGFAFAALATSLIGYAVSFPKQLVDTVKLIRNSSGGHGEGCRSEKTNGSFSVEASSNWNGAFVSWLVLVVPIFIASLFPTAFSKALDFAGIYANCFLFGVLPPAMAWIHRSSKICRSSNTKEVLLPGGNLVLTILFVIAVMLGFWH